MHILLVTADEATAEAIGRGLEGRGHTIDLAPTSGMGLAQASLRAYDAIVVDPAVPGRDALDTAAALRGRGGRVAVLPLNSLAGKDGPSLGFGAGRDEAPRAPALDDLVARLDLLRREGPDRAGPWTRASLKACAS